MKFLALFLLLTSPALAQVNNPLGVAGGDLSGTFPNPTVAKIGGTAISTSISTPLVTTASGDLSLASATGAVRIGSGSVPTIASGACGAASNGTVAAGSRSNAGTISIGGAATTGCTIVFASAMTTAPICMVYAANATAIGALVLPYVSANTVNGFVVTGAVLANTSFNYHCI